MVQAGEELPLVLLYAWCFFGFGLVRLRFNLRVGYLFGMFGKTREKLI
jgi:hypothetical protein